MSDESANVTGNVQTFDAGIFSFTFGAVSNNGISRGLFGVGLSFGVSSSIGTTSVVEFNGVNSIDQLTGLQTTEKRVMVHVTSGDNRGALGFRKAEKLLEKISAQPIGGAFLL